jgi:hypothetical protein
MTKRGYHLDNHSSTYQAIMATNAINIQGNILPPQWLKHLKYPKSGKPYSIAALLLSDIIYWYRPIMIRDEETGQPLAPRKKFKGDKLQRSYGQFAEMYGFGKEQIKNACHYLRDENLIILDFRTITTEKGDKLANVLFIGINPKRIKEITHEGGGIGLQTDTLSVHRPIRMGLQTDTNTKTTPKNTIQSDPLHEIFSLQGQEHSESTAPYPKDQFWGYRDAFLEIYQRKIGTYPVRDKKDTIVALGSEDDANPVLWEKSITEAVMNYSGTNQPPLKRIINVYRHGGDYKAAMATEFPENDKNGQEKNEFQTFDEGSSFYA